MHNGLDCAFYVLCLLGVQTVNLNNPQSARLVTELSEPMFCWFPSSSISRACQQALCVCICLCVTEDVRGDICCCYCRCNMIYLFVYSMFSNEKKTPKLTNLIQTNTDCSFFLGGGFNLMLVWNARNASLQVRLKKRSIKPTFELQLQKWF